MKSLEITRCSILRNLILVNNYKQERQHQRTVWIVPRALIQLRVQACVLNASLACTRIHPRLRVVRAALQVFILLPSFEEAMCGSLREGTEVRERKEINHPPP